ncbi:MAG: ATPase [Thermodesulfovibrio sp.]|nr:ATPase [Thermodesulfovibrio sp.]
MKIHNLAKDAVFQTLVTAENGLSEAEAAKRLSEFGLNEIKEVRKTPLSLRFLKQFTHFLAILLFIGAGLSFLSDYLHPGEGMFSLGVAIVGVIIINALFTFIQEYKAEKTVEKLRQFLPFSIRTIRDGKEKEIPSKDVVPGDIILLSEGIKVPADSRLIEASYLMVNNAPLTGESESVLLNVEPSEGELIESKNIAFAGATVISGTGKAVVFASGMRTEFGRIAHLTSAVESGLSPLQKEIVKATRVVAAIAASVGIIFFCLGLITGRNFWDNFIFTIGITVALIPEGMLPTVTLALAMGSQRMAKRKALIKTLTSVETLGSVTVICTDKTGTLTQNKMDVRKVSTEGQILAADNLKSLGNHPIMKTALLCNNARFVDGLYTGDPTEIALLNVAQAHTENISAARVFEIPFDSDRKRMVTVNVADGKTCAYAKGAIEVLLPLCTQVGGDNGIVPLDEDQRTKAVDTCHALMDEGLRVLAFAYKEIDSFDVKTPDPAEVETGLVFAGLIGLEDPPRPEVRDAIQKCNEAGIKVIMITGDGSRTAIAIAREIGLTKDTPVVIEGVNFEQMDDAELKKSLAQREVIFARMAPKHKMRVVAALQEEGEVVAVTGDGVNDAPALKKADIGIAMGISGTDVAKEASDMVLLDDNFATIVIAVEEGRAVYENIKKFITYIFASNIPEAIPYLAYILLNIPLPLTILQILAVDLGTDMLPALALGAEKPTPGIMKQPPRRRGERLLNFGLLTRAYLFLGPLEAVACMFGFFWVLHQGGWLWGEIPKPNSILYLQATTACLTAIVLTQIANVFACRSFSESVVSPGFFSNKLIFAGIAFELLLQLLIVYTPWGNRIFSTAPLSISVWGMLIPFMFLLLFADETRKLLYRSRRAKTG